MDLIPWDDFEPVQIYYFDGKHWEDTRVQCPECGAQLVKRRDAVPSAFTPQDQYRCPMCNWYGTK